MAGNPFPPVLNQSSDIRRARMRNIFRVTFFLATQMTPTTVSATALHIGRATNATPACCSIVLREQLLVAPEQVSSLSLCPRASILLFPMAQQNFHQNNYVLTEISASESPGGSEMLLSSIWSINLFDGTGAMSQNNCILLEITAPDSPGSLLLWPRGQIVLFSMARHIHQSAQLHRACS